jgi:hypothetical protein
MAIGRFRAANRHYWDGEVDLNLQSWDIEAFLGDPERLSHDGRRRSGSARRRSPCQRAM